MLFRSYQHRIYPFFDNLSQLINTYYVLVGNIPLEIANLTSLTGTGWLNLNGLYLAENELTGEDLVHAAIIPSVFTY